MVRLFPATVKDMSRKLEGTVTSDDYALGLLRHSCLRHALVKEANRHSVAIEHEPQARNYSQHTADRVFGEMMERQNRAWGYSMETVAKKGSFSARDLAIIATIMVPHQPIHPDTGFRMYDVKLTSASHKPPSPTKVSNEMQHLITQVLQMKSPLEKAIYAHFHIARIHPYEDGNGRTARMIQNTIMCGSHYIPILVAKDQRDLYVELLDAGCREFYKGEKKYLYPFAEFLVYNLERSIKLANKHPLRTLRRRAYEQ